MSTSEVVLVVICCFLLAITLAWASIAVYLLRMVLQTRSTAHMETMENSLILNGTGEKHHLAYLRDKDRNSGVGIGDKGSKIMQEIAKRRKLEVEAHSKLKEEPPKPAPNKGVASKESKPLPSFTTIHGNR